MTDDPSSDPTPADPGDPMGSEMISESELDDVLAQASSLAADLSEEIGQDAEPRAAGAASIDGYAEDASVEVGLEELERLVASTREEVEGAEAPEGDAPSEKPADLAVPDFMSEFTDPAPPADAADGPDAASPTPSVAAPAKDSSVISDPSLGIVATGTIKKETPAEPLGVVGTPSPATTEDSSAPAVDEPADEGETEPAVSRRAAIVQALTAKAGPILFMVCDRSVSVLEKIDRPLQRIGQVPRRLIGWLAIATLGTSLLAFIVSAF